MSTTNDFRRASGLSSDPLAGPGLFAVTDDEGNDHLTNVRRLAGFGRAPGQRVIAFATWLLVFLGAGLMYVSFQAQYTYIFAVKHVSAASMIEAAMLDAGMIILSALGIGLALAGKPSRVERFLIMVCAGLSAYMNYLAADTASWRSVVAYVAAPVFLAVIVDRVISVIRRHVLPLDAESAWQPMGRAVIILAKLSGLVALYGLRTVLAPSETTRGLRRMVLDAAPVPGVIVADVIEVPPAGEISENPEGTKKDRFLALYRAHADYGKKASASKVAAELAPQADLQAGTARSYVYGEINRVASIAEPS